MQNLDLMKTLVIVTGNKGGVGKSTVAQGMIEYAQYRGKPVHIAQVDRQQRLSQLNNCEVLTIDSDPNATREDPAAELARFGPLMDWIAARAGTGTLVLDLGANEVDRMATWARLCELNDDLIEAGVIVLVLIVFTAEEQAIQEARKTAEAMHRALPVGHQVYVENQRFGRISDLNARSETLASYNACIVPALGTSSHLIVPRIIGNSYQHFEQARIGFSTVAEMSVAEIMDATGLNRADSKIARGDIAQWLIKVFDGLDAFLGQDLFPGGRDE